MSYGVGSDGSCDFGETKLNEHFETSTLESCIELSTSNIVKDPKVIIIKAKSISVYKIKELEELFSNLGLSAIIIPVECEVDYIV